ncbi:Hypothetical protein CINCED_3A009031 [Cinara cedri]|uniref:Uncharacterized protein n=1 Tax=Cinara cedri TaxID=506608 RepID=A0A5E4MJ29_9HEMI|nr:Hypothetical protein CINCED_3A009031 [Cinara cedri]
MTRNINSQDKLVIENQADNLKKKCILQNPQSSKIEPENPKATKKEAKITKLKVHNSVKPTKNNDLREMSNTKQESLQTVNKSTNSMQIPLKINKNKNSKLFKKKSIMNDANISKTSNDFEGSDNFISSKNIKNISTVQIINIHDKSDDMKRSSNYLIPTSSKHVTSKSVKTNVAMENVKNDDNLSDKLETSNNLISLKPFTSKSINKPVKKKTAINNVNQIDTCIELESSDKKCDYSFLRKALECQKIDIANIYNDKDNLQQSKNLVTVNEKLPIPQDSKLINGCFKNNMMLRGNDRPKKKNKWYDDYVEIKSVKSHSPLSSGLKMNKSNCSKTIRKPRKSKNTDNKNVKNTISEKLSKSSIDSLSSNNSSSTLKNTDWSNLNISTTQSLDSISTTTNNISVIESTAINNYVIAESLNIDVKTNNNPNTTNFNPLEELTVDNNNVIFQITDENIDTNETIDSSDVTVLHKTVELVSDFSNSTVPMTSTENSEISYGISILSEAISRQCIESPNKSIKRKSSEPNNINEISPKKAKNNLPLQVPSAMVSPQRVHKNISRKVINHPATFSKQSFESDLQTNIEREIYLLSKRFSIPIDSLRKTVVLEPLSIFHKKYSESVTPSMVTVSPIVRDASSHFSYANGNLDVKYKIEPIREGAAYEKTNLKDLIQELTKTMPSWNLSIVTNPKRYVISQMSINIYGVPSANKSIVLDRYFRASVYINQSLEYKYSKHYTTAVEIVNLIKELDSL